MSWSAFIQMHWKCFVYALLLERYLILAFRLSSDIIIHFKTTLLCALEELPVRQTLKRYLTFCVTKVHLSQFSQIKCAISPVSFKQLFTTELLVLVLFQIGLLSKKPLVFGTPPATLSWDTCTQVVAGVLIFKSTVVWHHLSKLMGIYLLIWPANREVIAFLKTSLMSSKKGLRFGNNELPPSYLKECWADAHHRKIIISDSSGLQNEKHMEMEALKNRFLNSD